MVPEWYCPCSSVSGTILDTSYQPLLIIRSSAVVEHMYIRVLEQHTIIRMIRAKLAPVKPIMQVLRRQLGRKFDPGECACLCIRTLNGPTYFGSNFVTRLFGSDKSAMDT